MGSRARFFSKLNLDNYVQSSSLDNYVQESEATVANLANTTISSLSSGDILYYNGSNWINKSPVILKLNCVDNANINDTTTWTLRSVIDDTAAVINEGGFTFNNTTITVPEDGIYRCSFNFYIVEPGADYRMNPGARWAINDTLQNEISGCSYIRAANGHQTSSLHMTTIFDLSANDQLRIYWAQLGATGSSVYIEGSNSGINIEKIN